MDEIIWSSESLQLIASVLRESSREMEAENTRFRHCRSEMPQALKDNDGDLLDDILEQMDHEIRRLTDASERATELAGSVQFADTLFEETEWDVQRLFENIAVSAEAGVTIPSIGRRLRI